MGLDRPIESFPSVATWAKGLEEQWGEDVLARNPAKLRHLEAFCEFIGKDPEALVAFCFLRRKATGERFGSVQRRQEVAAQLGQFRSVGGLSAPEARRRQADVLSFLIHNGVLIQMGPA